MKYKLQYRMSKNSPWNDCINRELSVTAADTKNELILAAVQRASEYSYQYRVIEEVIEQRVHFVANGGDPRWS